MNRSSVLVAGLVALALMVPMAWAAPTTLDFATGLPVKVEGDRVVKPTDGRFVLQGNSGEADMVLHAEEGSLTRVLRRAYGVADSSRADVRLLWEQNVENRTINIRGGTMALQDRGPDFKLFAKGGSMEFSSDAGYVPVDLQESEFSVVFGKPTPREGINSFHLAFEDHGILERTHEVAAGNYRLNAPTGRFAGTGPSQMAIGGAILTVELEGKATHLNLGFREEQVPGQVYDPISRSWIGGGHHTEYVHEYAVIDLRQGVVELAVSDADAQIFGHELGVSANGTARFPRVTGNITVHDGDRVVTHWLMDQDLVMAGQFDLSMRGADRGRADVVGTGDVVLLQFAGQRHSYDWATISAASAGALLIGVALWATGSLKWLGGVVGYARVHGPEILEHPARRQIYEQIATEPGQTISELAMRTELGSSTLNFHLRGLERNGFVSKVKDGRYARYFDMKQGHYAGSRRVAASALRNDVTARVAASIHKQPGITQCDLADRFGMKRSSISWHLRRLCDQALAQKQRDKTYVRYYPGTKWSDLPAHELERLNRLAPGLCPQLAPGGWQHATNSQGPVAVPGLSG